MGPLSSHNKQPHKKKMLISLSKWSGIGTSHIHSYSPHETNNNLTVNIKVTLVMENLGLVEMEVNIIVPIRLTHVSVLKSCMNEHNMPVIYIFVCACLYTEKVNKVTINELLFYGYHGLKINIVMCV